MRIAAGYFFIIGFLTLFSFFLLGALQEGEDIKSVEAVLETETEIDTVTMPKNSYIYDKNGRVISEVTSQQNRRYVEYKDIPQLVKDAFLSTEDQQFFEHKGVDMSAVGRALIVNAKANSIEEGASTLTQQVVRNLYLSHEQSYNRKLSEVLYSYQLEQDYSKREILEFYVNTIYFNNGIYGFETASQSYFNKPSKELSLAEVAFLASIPANPEHYDPLTKKENTKLRQEWVLTKMQETGAISEERKADAMDEPIHITFSKKTDLYPSYTFYIEHELKQLIAAEEGYKNQLENAGDDEKEEIEQKLNDRVDELWKSGIHIETSLHPEIQESVTSAVNEELDGSNVQGAAVVIDHATNRIVAMNGGKQYQKYDFQRAFQAYRQPGSAIKPLLVYGPYFEETEASTSDMVSSDPFCRNDYCPSNAGGDFYGNVTMETAFAQSYNTSALRLFDHTGIKTSFSYLEKFRFSKLQSDDYHYAAALGGFSHGVSPLELTDSYTVFSNHGEYTPSRGIKSVTDEEGNVLYEWEDSSQQLWKEETNQKLRQLMRSVLTEGTAGFADIKGEEWRGKTGTTNKYHDLWFVGYGDRYTAGVWVGEDNPASLEPISSRLPHLSLWKQITSHIPES
ncbi:penicillin-binding protein 1A [Salibacterium salarium]|uniref:transglycosylase domain-containing protein n=1 Tax=Salibacterium salarium TaxID=284579 RepID=UPI00277ED8F4|nr:transglycosylase domain-containing protein [Salibacterium salarium]MDQ0299912.1 penicillin-binding protein 1A [Salibacterium salarium]